MPGKSKSSVKPKAKRSRFESSGKVVGKPPKAPPRRTGTLEDDDGSVVDTYRDSKKREWLGKPGVRLTGKKTT